MKTWMMVLLVVGTVAMAETTAPHSAGAPESSTIPAPTVVTPPVVTAPGKAVDACAPTQGNPGARPDRTSSAAGSLSTIRAY